LADNLGGHSATAAAAATRTTAAEAAATASAVAAASEAIAAAEAVATAKPVSAPHERIETFLSETVPLVASPTATSSVKTHLVEYTFVSPDTTSPGGVDESHRTSGQTSAQNRTALSCSAVLIRFSVQ